MRYTYRGVAGTSDNGIITEVDFDPINPTSICNSAFSGFYILTHITIPVTVTSIGADAFGDCPSLLSIIIPPRVTTIGLGAFYECRALQSIIIPPSVISLGEYAFTACFGINNITLYEGITTLSKEAFSTTAISRIVIPASVTTMGPDVFILCNNLTSITYLGTSAASTISTTALSGVPATVVNVPYNFVGTSFGGLPVIRADPPAITAPTNITASVSSGNITVSWDSTNPSGASYSLYNGTSPIQLTDNTNKSHTINGAAIGNYTFYVTATYTGKTSVRCGPAIVSVSPTTANATAIITNPTRSSVLSGSTLSTVVLTGGTAGPTGAPTVPGFFAFQNPLQSITASGDYPVVFYPSNPKLYSRSAPVNMSVTVTTQSEVATALAGTATEKAAAVTSLLTGFNDTNKQVLADNVAGATVSLTAEQAKSLLTSIPFLSSVTTVASLSVIVPTAAKAVEIPPMANGSFVYLPLITNTTYYATYQYVSRQILYDSGTLYIGPVLTSTLPPTTPLNKATATACLAGRNFEWVPANGSQRAIYLKLPGLGGAYFGPDGEIVPCFPTGTRVLTAAGYKAVESLQKTDRIVTPDGRSLPFKLYSTVIEKTTEATAPYHIPKGTIGNKGAITLSPQHAIQSAKGVWQIPRNAAKRFSAIRQVNLGERVEYFHLELPNFFTDNIVAEGNIVESFGANQARGINSIYTYSAELKGCTRIAQRPVTKSLTL